MCCNTELEPSQRTLFLQSALCRNLSPSIPGQHLKACNRFVTAGSQGHSTRLGRRMHVELATAPRIMRRWFSASLRLGRRPTHEELATSPRIMRRWFSASLRFGRRPTHVELATAPRIMRRWFSASLRVGRRPTCGAGNSTADYATLVSASLRLGRRPTCGAGYSTTDYATLVFSVAPPWPMSNT
jgi:hypothetical protein